MNLQKSHPFSSVHATSVPLTSTRCSLGRGLLVLMGSMLLLLVVSYVLTRTLIPSLFPRWGYLLMALLTLWSATSAWLVVRGYHLLRRLVPLSALAALIIGMMWSGAGYIALFGGVLPVGLGVLLLVALVVILMRLRGRRAPATLLLLGYLPLLAASVAVLADSMAHWRTAIPATPMSAEAELRYLYEADQADRASGLFILDSSRDAMRLARTEVLDHQEQITTPQAQYYAALVFQHGSCPLHFQRAYELAHTAVKAGYTEALWLDHASYDRWMLATGRPQKYQTQVASFDLRGNC